ncbi:MAG TPA: aldehyde dehydrogenase family protein [Chloroflexota bacterium]|jgi:succinate-semialdehyde dehydrogenase/glutarate-semialdehyde dehydrogenase|nr:aldehyde dehydrogenase family protein [Chloroflexota bacterium]
MFINGERVGAASGATTEVRNPASGEVVDTVPQADAEDTKRAIEAAAAAFPTWSKMPPTKRSHILMAAAALVRQNLDEIARLLTQEQGKPIRDSKIEAERFVENIEIYAGMIKGGVLAGKQIPLPSHKAQGMVVRRPIGVVGAIIPWNFPLTLMANKIAPAMAVGNTVVVKPASTTPLATLRLAELMAEGGLPPGVLNVVTGPGAIVGEEIIRHPLVRKIGFTGETGTGKQVAKSAADELKHVTLELGGSDAAIVCDDADIDLAARTVAIGRFFNAGQACLAVKRVFVFDSVADEFIDKIAARAKRLKLGSGTDADAQMGPLHTDKQRAEIESQLADAVQRGGRVVAGGNRPAGANFQNGFFFEPTVVVDVPPGARVWTEETFGPLLPIMRVKDLDEALEQANSSEFGLGSSIFTRDMSKAQRAIDELEAGYTWVNAVQIAHDELPFGGTKHSGYGKEHGTEVLDYYTEQKSVVVAN